MPSFEGNLFTQWHQSHLALNPYRVVTDRQSDRIPIANTCSQQYLPVQLSRVKTVVVESDKYGG